MMVSPASPATSGTRTAGRWSLTTKANFPLFSRNSRRWPLGRRSPKVKRFRQVWKKNAFGSHGTAFIGMRKTVVPLGNQMERFFLLAILGNKPPTVEPPCATTSRKRPPPISDHLSKTPSFSESKPYQCSWNRFVHKRPRPLFGVTALKFFTVFNLL